MRGLKWGDMEPWVLSESFKWVLSESNDEGDDNRKLKGDHNGTLTNSERWQ